jgi:AraC family transcriptional regulator
LTTWKTAHRTPARGHLTPDDTDDWWRDDRQYAARRQKDRGDAVHKPDLVRLVRLNSEIRLLKVDLPDEAFRAIAEEAGAQTIEIRSSTKFEDKRVDALISAVQAEEEAGGLSGRLFMDSIAQALASALVQLRGNLKRNLPQYHCGLTPTQLSRVKQLVYGRMDREVSLQEMAGAARLSSSYFNQMFRRSTGLAAHQFVLNARVEHAKDLLKSPGLRMIDVAVSCGFQTSQHFARVFRSLCAVTPTEYRRALGVTS